MKKIFILLILAFSAQISSLNAQVFRRTEKQPSFFMPKQQKTTEEKRPSAEKMINQKQQTSNVAETQHKATVNAEKKAQQAPLPKPKETAETPKQKPLQQVSKKETEKQNTSKKATLPKPIETAPVYEKELTPYEYAFEEYQRDLADIKQSQKTQNIRIMQVVGDFKDIDRVLQP